MGRGSESVNTQQFTDIAAMGPEEQKLVDRMTQLGVSQADAISTVMEGAKAMRPVETVALRGADQALLDQAYGGAEFNLRRFGQLMGQDLAGTRGLNPSDTPVSEAVLRETMPAMASLQSDKAQQALGLGFNLANLNEGSRQFNMGSLLNAGQAMPTAAAFNLNRMQNERFARGRTYGSSYGVSNQPLMQTILQGTQAFNQLGQGMGQFMKMFSGGQAASSGPSRS